MFRSNQKRRNPRKHPKSKPSAFNQKVQKSHFNILGRKSQSAARTNGKAQQMNKRKNTLWNEYWGQKRDSQFIDQRDSADSPQFFSSDNSFDSNRKRKRPHDDFQQHDPKRIRRTGLSSVSYEDNKMSKVARIVSRDREKKREKQRLKLETMDEIDQLDQVFNQQRVQFFSQKSVVGNTNPKNPMRSTVEDYDILVRDLVNDSRAEPTRVKQLTQTELEIAREQFQAEEKEVMESFMKDVSTNDENQPEKTAAETESSQESSDDTSSSASDEDTEQMPASNGSRTKSPEPEHNADDSSSSSSSAADSESDSDNEDAETTAPSVSRLEQEVREHVEEFYRKASAARLDEDGEDSDAEEDEAPQAENDDSMSSSDEEEADENQNAEASYNAETPQQSDIQDSQEEDLNRAIEENQFIRQLLDKGQDALSQTLKSFERMTSLPRDIPNLSESLIELLRFVGGQTNPSAAFIKCIIQSMRGISRIAPRKLVVAFKDDLQIMYGRVNPERGFASGPDLLVCKAILSLYSTQYKDGRPHEVVHPLLIFICKNLSECQIRSHQDLLRGIFLCDLCLHYYGGFLPEVTNFLFNAASTINGGQQFDTIHPRIPPLRSDNRDWLMLSKGECKPFRKQSFPELSFCEHVLCVDPHESVFDTKWKISCQVTIASLLHFAISLHKHLPSFKEIYQPLMSVFERLKVNHRPTLKQYRSLVGMLTEEMDRCEKQRNPLQYKKTIPKEQTSYEAKLFETAIRGKKVGATEEEINRKVLGSKVKRMKRQAVRELRRDNEFLRHTRDVDQGRKAHESKQRYKEALAHLDRERTDPVQYDFSIMDREKKIADIRKKQRRNSNKRR